MSDDFRNEARIKVHLLKLLREDDEVRQVLAGFIETVVRDAGDKVPPTVQLEQGARLFKGEGKEPSGESEYNPVGMSGHLNSDGDLPQIETETKVELTTPEEGFLDENAPPEEQIAALKNKVAALKVERDGWKNECDGWKNERKGWENERDALKSNIENLSDELEYVQRSKERIEDERDILHRDLEDVRAKVERLNAEIARLRDENSRLFGQIQAKDEKINNLSTQLTALDKRKIYLN